MHILVRSGRASTRNNHMNQALGAYRPAFKRSRPQSKAPDSRHERQTLRQTFVMASF
jgi:hypothetical protein